MTFNFAPWAVDGARTGASSARVLARAATGGRSGIVSPWDLRVLPLAVNGNGIRISSGNAAILNYYLADPDESYVVSNPATHTVLPADMPAPIPTTGYYLVCVVVGDPFYNQTGHPFMPSTPLPPEDAPDFEYVRVVIIPCNPGTTSFEDLGYTFPAYALARLEVPPNTTTITAPMIVDLRSLLQPRSERQVVLATPSSTPTNLTAESFATWTDTSRSIQIPRWARKVKIIAHIGSSIHWDPEVQGQIRLVLGDVYGTHTAYAFDDSAAPGGAERVSLIAALEGDVSHLAGSTQTLRIEGLRFPGYTGYLSTYDGQVHVYDIEFSEVNA